MTVRQAVRSLVLAGYCYRARGRGIFVRRRVFINTQRFEGFTASMRRAGRRASTVSLGSAISTPPDWVREGLELDDDEQTVELVRLRILDDVPAILETEWFAARRFGGMVSEDMSRFALHDPGDALRDAHHPHGRPAHGLPALGGGVRGSCSCPRARPSSPATASGAWPTGRRSRRSVRSTTARSSSSA